MAVRAFTTSDILDCATGALATGTFGTQAIIVKRAATGSWHTFLALHNSGGSALTQFAYSSADVNALWVNGDTATGSAALGTTAWGLLVVRKPTGSVAPRFSVYNFTTATWTHAAGSMVLPNWTAPGASGTVRFRWESFDQFAGRVAVRAAWNSLPWSADTTGDAALEAAGLHTSLQKWVDASPSSLWSFDQAAVTTAVTDLTGGGANQTSRTGTTVVTGDDPPGFSFTLGGGGQTVTATGIGTGEAFGTPTVTRGTVTVTPGGLASAESFGGATVQRGQVTVSLTGIASAEAFGTAAVSVGAATITPIAMPSAEAFGIPAVSAGAVVVAAQGVDSGEVFGAPTVSVGGLTVLPAGIASAEQVGAAAVTVGLVTVAPDAIGSTEAFGSPVVSSGDFVIAPVGVGSAEIVGSPTVTPGTVSVAPTGIASSESVGAPVLVFTIAPLGIGSLELLGTPAVLAGPVTLTPAGIVSAETFGSAALTGGQVLPTPAERTFTTTAGARVFTTPAESRRLEA